MFKFSPHWPVGFLVVLRVLICLGYRSLSNTWFVNIFSQGNGRLSFDKSVISLPASVVSYMLSLCFLVSHLCVYLGNWQIYWRKIACIFETFLLVCPFSGTCPPSTFSISSSTSSSWSSWPSRMPVPGYCVVLLLSTFGEPDTFCLQSKYIAHVKMCSHLSHKRHVWRMFWNVLKGEILFIH